MMFQETASKNIVEELKKTSEEVQALSDIHQGGSAELFEVEWS